MPAELFINFERKSAMKISHIIMIVAVSFAVAACGGSPFEWFPKTADTTPPNITATINGAAIFTNRTTHTSLPANVTFSADEPATIFYSTNGSEPSSVYVPGTNVLISLADTILKFFGRDSDNNQSATISVTIKSP